MVLRCGLMRYYPLYIFFCKKIIFTHPNGHAYPCRGHVQLSILQLQMTVKYKAMDFDFMPIAYSESRDNFRSIAPT